MSESFFHQSIPGDAAPTPGANKLRDSSLRSRKGGSGRAAPPPPPRPGGGGTAGASSSYYSSNSGTMAAAAAPPAAAHQASASSSYYGSPSSTPAAANAATGSSSYYSSSTAPAAVPAAAPAAAPAAGSSDWYTAPAAANAPAPAVAQPAGQQPAGASDWYTPNTTTSATSAAFAPAPAQQQQQQPSIMNPYMPQAQTASSSLEGAMDTAGVGATTAAAATTRSSGSGFSLSGLMGGSSKTTVPHQAPSIGNAVYGFVPYDPFDFENEPPLLHELGINVEHILLKTRAVLLPFVSLAPKGMVENPRDIVQDADLAGPLAFALLLGGELLLTGKIHFGYIYTSGLFGCLSMTLVLNLMSPSDPVSVWTVMSILGYALLPVNMLALVKILMLGYMESLGRVFGIATIAWCTVAATRLLEQGCGMRDQRYLVAYPIALLYSAFVMITIF